VARVTDILLGLVAIFVGLLFCFAGQFALRLVITIWGAFAGFAMGAGLVAQLAGEGFLATTLGWVVGLALGLVFAILAYLFYAVAVILTMGAIGYALAAALMVALGVDWEWLIVLVGVAVGILLAIAAIAFDLPLIVLIVLSGMGGAAVAVCGLMLIFGAMDAETFTQGGFVAQVRDDWWWYLTYLALAIMGVLTQSRAAGSRQRSVRAQWASQPV
jgi:hypothetical protein